LKSRTALPALDHVKAVQAKALGLQVFGVAGVVAFHGINPVLRQS
jgi:hypothetical protein